MEITSDIDVAIEDPALPDIRPLLERHLHAMNAVTPSESVHALDLDALRSPGVTFYTARHDSRLLGCGALQRLDDGHGEIKSMHTAIEARCRGIARLILARIIGDAASFSYQRLSLETGSASVFAVEFWVCMGPLLIWEAIAANKPRYSLRQGAYHPSK